MENVRGGGELRPRVCVSVCLWPGPWSAADRCGTPSLGLTERASPVWVPGPPCVPVFLPRSLSLSLTLILFPPLSVSSLICLCVCLFSSFSVSALVCLSLWVSLSLSVSVSVFLHVIIPLPGFPQPLLTAAGRKGLTEAVLGKATEAPLLPFVASAPCPHPQSLPHRRLGLGAPLPSLLNSVAPQTSQ